MNPSRPPADRIPATPDEPVAGYYKCPGPGSLWLYYDGATWVGHPVELAWYKRPMTAFRGRPPVWASLVFAAVVVAVAVVVGLVR